MFDQDDYADKLSTLNALSVQLLRAPNMPVDIYASQAENLYHWCQEDVEELIDVGLDWYLLADIPQRVAILRAIHSAWLNQCFEQPEAQRRLSEVVLLGYQLRKHILISYQFAFRHRAEMLDKINSISIGVNIRHKLADELYALAEMGQDNVEILDTSGFNLRLLEEAAIAADSLTELMTESVCDRQTADQMHDLCNRAYTYLKLAVDEICQCGQYLFRSEEARRSGYQCHFDSKLFP